jgi:hypothetical protein
LQYFARIFLPIDGNSLLKACIVVPLNAARFFFCIAL